MRELIAEEFIVEGLVLKTGEECVAEISKADGFLREYDFIEELDYEGELVGKHGTRIKVPYAPDFRLYLLNLSMAKLETDIWSRLWEKSVSI